MVVGVNNKYYGLSYGADVPVSGPRVSTTKILRYVNTHLLAVITRGRVLWSYSLPVLLDLRCLGRDKWFQKGGNDRRGGDGHGRYDLGEVETGSRRRVEGGVREESSGTGDGTEVYCSIVEGVRPVVSRVREEDDLWNI